MARLRIGRTLFGSAQRPSAGRAATSLPRWSIRPRADFVPAPLYASAKGEKACLPWRRRQGGGVGQAPYAPGPVI